jgi:hypothetical protein
MSTATVVRSFIRNNLETNTQARALAESLPRKI